MTTHTPGPWTFNGIEPTGETVAHHGKVRAGPKHIADCFYGATHADIAANARVISAAPELLKALKDIIDLGPVSEDLLDQGFGREINLTSHHIRAAQAAIEKATAE